MTARTMAARIADAVLFVCVFALVVVVFCVRRR